MNTEISIAPDNLTAVLSMRHWLRWTLTLILGAALLMGVVLWPAGDTEAAVPPKTLTPTRQGIRWIELKAPDGDLVVLSSAADSKARSIRKKWALDLSRGNRSKAYLCANAKPTEWRLTKRLEVELELAVIIAELNRQNPKERQLSEAQEEFLRELPLCEPLDLDLAVISRLVRGYAFQSESFKISDRD